MNFVLEVESDDDLDEFYDLRHGDYVFAACRKILDKAIPGLEEGDRLIAILDTDWHQMECPHIVIRFEDVGGFCWHNFVAGDDEMIEDFTLAELEDVGVPSNLLDEGAFYAHIRRLS